MLRHRKYFEPYPCRTVVEDVLIRSGHPDENCFTPFDGLYELIGEQFKGSAADRFTLQEFLDYVKDNDFDPTKRFIAEKLLGMELQDKHNAGYKRLEDCIEDQGQVKKYITDLMIGYKKNAASPYRVNAREDIRTLRNYEDDDGDEIDERLLRTKETEIDQDLFYKTVELVPYLLKRIHQRSKLMHAHLFSFLRAYAIILTHKAKKDIVPKDFESHQLYRMKSNGEIDRLFNHVDDNKGADYPPARRFILGEHPEDSVYKNCMELLNCFEILGIDISREDPYKYNNDFINRLQCKHLPTNEEYFEGYGNVDPEVIEALKVDNLFKPRGSVMLGTGKDICAEDDVICCIKSYLDVHKIEDPSFYMGWSDKLDDIYSYIKEYTAYYTRNRAKGPQIVDLNLFTVFNDFVYYKSKMVKLPGDYINRYNGYYPKVIFHRSGLVIVLSETFEGLLYATIDDCKDRLGRVKAGIAHEEGWNSL